MYERYDNHCRYFGIVSKLTKNPLKSRTGIADTGPTNTATCTFCSVHCLITGDADIKVIHYKSNYLLLLLLLPVLLNRPNI